MESFHSVSGKSTSCLCSILLEKKPHCSTQAEQNYDVCNRELLAIRLAVEKWRHWPEGTKHIFLVLIDHKNLECLHEVKRLNPKECRELFFTIFNFTISYVLSSKDAKADALSRLHYEREKTYSPETILPPHCVISAVHWDFDDNLDNTLPYATPEGCLPNLKHVPPHLRNKLIASSGHPVTQWTYEMLQEKYWWPNMSQMINK